MTRSLRGMSRIQSSTMDAMLVCLVWKQNRHTTSIKSSCANIRQNETNATTRAHQSPLLLESEWHGQTENPSDPSSGNAAKRVETIALVPVVVHIDARQRSAWMNDVHYDTTLPNHLLVDRRDERALGKYGTLIHIPSPFYLDDIFIFLKGQYWIHAAWAQEARRDADFELGLA